MSKIYEYDVVIIGAGVSGTALFYLLGHFTDVKRIALIEKCDQVAQVNSHHNNNSQTLHFGDIETNYTVEKAKRVKAAADLVKTYVDKEGKHLYNKTHKMVLAVGQEEVDKLSARYEDFKELFPSLKKIGREELAKLEPKIVEGRGDVPLLALVSPDGYAINYRKLSESFVDSALKLDKNADRFLGTTVEKISYADGSYCIHADRERIFKAPVVVVAAGSHSLIFAHKLGYGKEFGLLPVAGSFYRAKHLLNGKVYTLQMKKLPFAAIHGDPDVNNPMETRFGPTAKVLPMLERHQYKTVFDFLKVSIWKVRGVLSLLKIASDWILIKYVLRNLVYDIPFLGKYAFLQNVRKIVPTSRYSDLYFGGKIGGIRPQMVDTNNMELNMGEAKIVGENIIFNITPSPGASVCLKTAEQDTVRIMNFFKGKFTFDQKKFDKYFEI
jgi:malate dehydrogenase (quinone)